MVIFYTFWVVWNLKIYILLSKFMHKNKKIDFQYFKCKSIKKKPNKTFQFG